MLVHCYQGKSRSCAVICAFLSLRLHLSLDEALLKVREVRPQAEPNAGFWAVLARRERKRERDAVGAMDEGSTCDNNNNTDAAGVGVIQAGM